MPDDRASRVEITAALLLDAAVRDGATVSGDGRVCESVAASLLGVSALTMRNWRAAGDGPEVCNRPCGGGKLSYRLMALAEWIEAGFDENNSPLHT